MMKRTGLQGSIPRYVFEYRIDRSGWSVHNRRPSGLWLDLNVTVYSVYVGKSKLLCTARVAMVFGTY